MKKIITLVILFIGLFAVAQHKKILYSFDKVPQGLLLNPGMEIDYKFHIGVPLLSGISAHHNISGVTLADLFRNDAVGIFKGEEFNKKFIKAIGKLDDNDYMYFNSQIDVLNAGYKLNDRDYLSGGFYIETDVFTTLPKELAVLMTEGNTKYINKAFKFGSLALQGEMVGILHIGLSRKLNEKLTVGGRIKLYSGAVNVTSLRNLGTFTTSIGIDSKYIHSLKGVDVALKTSGFYDANDQNVFSSNRALTHSFFGGNYGLGFDLGFTYHIDDQSELTGSVLDFGYIRYSKDNENKVIKGSYTFTGVEFDFKNQTEIADYWSELERGYNEEIERSDNKEAYTITRPLKAYLNYAYSFGRSRNRKTCHDNTYKEFFDNTVGGQLFSIVQPKGLNFAYTVFYQRKFSKHLSLKATYTIDDFSYSNIGLGASVNVWKLNVYGTIGNVFGVSDVIDSHSTSAQIGVNFIVD